MWMDPLVGRCIADIELIRYDDIKSPARVVVRRGTFFIQHHINGTWLDSKQVTREEVRQRHPILRWI